MSDSAIKVAVSALKEIAGNAKAPHTRRMEAAKLILENQEYIKEFEEESKTNGK